MKAVGFLKSLPITDAESLLDVDVPEPVPLANDLLVDIVAISVNPADAKRRIRTAPETPHAEPFILDNLENKIKPASERPDLLPVFSFNGTGLWLAKERGRGKLVGSSSRYKHWQDLLGRMPEGLN